MSDSRVKRLRWLSYSIVLILASYILVLFFTLNQDTVNIIQKVPPSLYFWLLLLSFSSYLFRFIRWYSFLSPLENDISVKEHLLIYLSGFAMTMTPGKVGEMVRSFYLATLGIEYAQSLAAFFSDRILDVLAVLTLSVFLFVWSFPEYKLWIALGAGVILFLFFLLRSTLLPLLIKKFFKERSKTFLLSFQNSVRTFLDNRSLHKVLPLSLLAWAVQGYGLYIIVKSLGFEADPLLVIGIYNISILAGALSFIPGGIGTTEAAISLLLISLGMESSLALFASIICRGMTLWIAIMLGMVSLWFLGSKQKK